MIEQQKYLRHIFICCPPADLFCLSKSILSAALRDIFVLFLLLPLLCHHLIIESLHPFPFASNMFPFLLTQKKHWLLIRVSGKKCKLLGSDYFTKYYLFSGVKQMVYRTSFRIIGTFAPLYGRIRNFIT